MGQFFRQTIGAQALADASRPVVYPLGWRLLWSIVVHRTTPRASYMHLLPSLCWHVRPLGVLVRSLDSSAPSQGVEGSSAEVLAGGYESQSSKAIVLWSFNCASDFQQKWCVVPVGISKYVMLSRGRVGFPR